MSTAPRNIESSSALNFFHTVTTKIAAADPLHDVLDETIEFVSEFVPCDSCFIFLKEGEDMVLRASKNSHPGVLNILRIPMGQGITGWVAEKSEPVILSERAFEDARFRFIDELPEDRYEAFLSMPIVSRGRVVGVVNVQNRDAYEFTPREIKIISTLGHLMGAAIEMARLGEQVNQLSDKLEARKLVERAKGVLQRDLGINEEESYVMIQKQARQRRKSMKEISHAILLSDDLRKTS